MPATVTPATVLVLHRFTVKPGHLGAWEPLFEQRRALWDAQGWHTHRVFVETDAEPKVTWLYSGAAGTSTPVEWAELEQQTRPHVFGNALVRMVNVEFLTEAVPGEAGPLGAELDRIAIMRRYSIVGDWDDFLGIWRRIVPLRERHGFHCLFAVADREKDMFTWAFDFAGQWEDFGSGQREYYRDPERVALRGVFDHMADYSIHPAHCLV
ncbi:hypothetical protein M3G03_01890 [Aestuariimicrobium sp. p3-SID1156]|uniref:hypothetical protein n=1 Tax=Aestuariimicrobium sp. p3-SID1156 TaxID=2916038 RepID=UPI00223B929E|nr:hypothetical protein [Aestuariimicrobium sp. p3-SID1156]MCT1458305.1 hypothetical protein [Aestuariimicrobium sp. p3-SID1156]